MNSMQDLIDVSFVDATNYPSLSSGEDVMGVVLNYHWGPVNKMMVLDKTAFFEMYPESMPLGAENVPLSAYYAYAQIKKAFNNGLSKVEVVRYNDTKWSYSRIDITKAEGEDPVVSDAALQSDANDTETPICISTKYPGYVPASMLSGYDSFGVKISIIDSVVTLQVQGIKGSTKTVIEEFTGSYNPNAINDDGSSNYIQGLVNNGSKFVNIFINSTAIASLTATEVAFNQFDPEAEFPTFESSDVANLKKVYDNDFSDIERSKSTMMISPMDKSNSSYELELEILNITNNRKECIGVLGYPLAETSFASDSIKTAIKTWKATVNPDGKMFGALVACRESISLFNQPMMLNGVGGWCGSTAQVAKDVRLNQLASARTYGGYVGTLVETLNFNDVLTLHDEDGIISIYQAYTGPTIFGIRSTYKRGTSYFGKLNVIRVTAAVLKEVFPLALDAIHTDVSSNPITRNQFEITLNTIIGKYIAAQNLKPESKAICDDSINTDALTNGGEILNIILEMWYIKLTERVRIKIVATDSSVTAEII